MHNLEGDGEFAGCGEQAERARDTLHLAIRAARVPLGKYIDQVAGLDQARFAVGDQRLDKGDPIATPRPRGFQPDQKTPTI